MPRLKVKASEQRKNQFNIRFSDLELEIVEAYLKKKGIKVRGRFFRECIMQHIINEFAKETKDKELNFTSFITKRP